MKRLSSKENCVSLYYLDFNFSVVIQTVFFFQCVNCSRHQTMILTEASSKNCNLSLSILFSSFSLCSFETEKVDNNKTFDEKENGSFYFSTS